MAKIQSAIAGAKGAYSAIVYIDGSMYVADDSEGNLIQEGTVAATIIQAAIDNLPAVGGKVLLSEGEYPINTAIVMPDYSTLEGYSWASKLKLTVNDRIIENENFSSALDITPGSLDSKIRIANLSFDADTKNTSAHVLDMVGVDFVEYENIKIQNSASFCAELRSCTNFFAKNIYCYTTGALSRDGVKLWDSRQGVVNGIHGDTSDDLFSIGAKNFHVYNIGVSNIVGKSSLADVFKLIIEDTPGANAKIENITANNIICRYAAARGITIDHENTARTIKNITLNNIIIEDADSQGINIGTVAERISLNNIVIASAGLRGISISSSCKYITISNFYIENYANVTSGHQGILADANAENIIISNGTVRNGDGDAVVLYQCGNGCIISNVNADGGANIGCYIAGAIAHFTITGNHFKSSGNALLLDGNLDDGVIVGNDIDGGTADTAVKNNVIIANNA